MPASNQPLKLNYAKGRQKSKSKIDLQSQQKIQFEGESSTDIFSHLNQDNLNYIKKQLKHKKASQSLQKTKTTNLSLQQTKEPKEPNIQAKNFKIFDKFTNFNEEKGKNLKQQRNKIKQHMNDSILVESIEDTTSPQEQIINQDKQSNEKQKNQYQGLQPPPLTYITKNKQIPQQSKSIQNRKQKQKRQVNDFQLNNQTVKNNFLQYELKSQTSNNQLERSNLSEEKQSSKNFSLNQKGSQFIGYLESYIQELEGTAAKRFVRGKESAFSRQSGPRENQNKNFRKNKQKNLPYQLIQSTFSEQSPSYKLTSRRQNDDQKKININKRKDSQQANYCDNQTENQSPILDSNDIIIEDLKKQLQRQKYYCTKLALELQKYKENESKNGKQMIFLQKTIQLLKIQIENVKQLYQNQAQKTQKILEFVQNQKHKEQQEKRKQKQLKKRRQKFNKQPQLNFRHKSFNEPSTKREPAFKNQFEDLLKFKQTQKTYSNLNKKMMDELMKDFQKGHQAYNNEKKTARIKHNRTNNQQSDTQKFAEKNEKRNEPKSKANSKNSSHQKNYLENLLKFNDRNKEFIKYKKEKQKEIISSSSQQEISRKQTSLQKLKRQYEIFRQQTKTARFDNKKYNQKKDSYSHIFVK